MFKYLSIIIFLLFINSINSDTPKITALSGISNIKIIYDSHTLSFSISCNYSETLSSNIENINLNLYERQSRSSGQAVCTLKQETLNLDCEIDKDNFISLQNSTDLSVSNVQTYSGYEFVNFNKVSSTYYINEYYKEIQCLNYKLNLNIYTKYDLSPGIMEFKLKYKIQNHKDEADCFFPPKVNEILCVMDASNFTFLKGKTITFDDNINLKLNTGSNITFNNLDKIVMEDTCGKDSYGNMININIWNIIILIIFSFIGLRF